MKELGNRVHLTGQAVKNRVERLEQLGYIKHYTFSMNCPLYGYKIHALVRTSIHFAKKNTFLQFIKTCGHPIIHCYQITGENAYVLDMHFLSMESIQDFTNSLELFGPCEVQVILHEVDLDI